MFICFCFPLPSCPRFIAWSAAGAGCSAAQVRAGAAGTPQPGCSTLPPGESYSIPVASSRRHRARRQLSSTAKVFVLASSPVCAVFCPCVCRLRQHGRAPFLVMLLGRASVKKDLCNTPVMDLFAQVSQKERQRMGRSFYPVLPHTPAIRSFRCGLAAACGVE